METPAHTKRLLKVLAGTACFPPPVWLMRQAGRYLPEYLELRAKAPSFLDFCYTPALSAEATLQPVRRFGFDAAILFSDILVLPYALGQKVHFDPAEGPKLKPIVSEADLSALDEQLDRNRVAPVLETIDRVKQNLPNDVALIGFCGAPWTVACYMVAGKSSPDQAPARLLAYREHDFFSRIIKTVVDASIDYLTWQIDAGVEVVQIFDTWAGVLPASQFDEWCVAPVKAIVAGLKARRRRAIVIGFAKTGGSRLVDFASQTKVDAVGLDTTVDIDWAARTFGQSTVLQGNLDPLALVASGAAMERGVKEILSVFRARPHIFNLGHGILPQTPISHVAKMLDLVRGKGGP
ncbi:MAG TPA: uroporphyrinogen decarboxylase [Methylocella sp.]|nr:uroporphyrinogen decarboxylase [Methylocella sp.]